MPPGAIPGAHDDDSDEVEGHGFRADEAAEAGTPGAGTPGAHDDDSDDVEAHMFPPAAEGIPPAAE